VIVVGTQSRDPEMRTLVREKAEALAVHWDTWQHVRPRMVDDTAVTPEMERSLTLVLIGGPDENALSRRSCPAAAAGDADGGDRRRKELRRAGRDPRLHLSEPACRRPLRHGRRPDLGGGHAAVGSDRLLARLARLPHQFYDWTLRDRRQTSPVPGLAADREWIASGVFDQSWRRDDRWTFLGVGREGTPMSLTRRSFLERLGAVGGVSAVYLGMEAMGLLNASPASAEPFALPPGSGRGRKVVILGAGIAGLVSAYELRRAGWDVTVLEAPRPHRRPGVDHPRRRPHRPDRPARPALRLLRRPLLQRRRGAGCRRSTTPSSVMPAGSACRSR
jgi:hypothetical protein